MEQKKPHRTHLMLGAMLLALAACNVLLIVQNLRLRAELSRYEVKGLQVGEKLRPFKAVGLDGRPVEVTFGGSGPKRVLLFFTPTCRYCHEQFPYWRELLSEADPNRFEIIGVVSQAEHKAEIEAYLRSVGFLGEAGPNMRVAFVPDDVRENYKLHSTPITLVVASDGTLEKAWRGRWSPQDLAAANAVFGIKLRAGCKINFSGSDARRWHKPTA
jgi:peroxiredoxin